MSNLLGKKICKKKTCEGSQKLQRGAYQNGTNFILVKMTSTLRIFTVEQESTPENLNFNIHNLYPPQCCMALQFCITKQNSSNYSMSPSLHIILPMLSMQLKQLIVVSTLQCSACDQQKRLQRNNNMCRKVMGNVYQAKREDQNYKLWGRRQKQRMPCNQ